MATDDKDIELCCAILQEKAVEFLVNDDIKPSFLRKRGRKIFEYMKGHYAKFGDLPTLDTIHGQLSLEDGTMDAFFDELDTVDYYIDLLRNRAVCLEIDSWKGKVGKALIKSDGEEAVECVKELYEKILKMQSSTTGEVSMADFSETAEERWQDYKRAEKMKGGIIGYKFPWDVMNQKTQGIQDGNLIIIIGSTGMGKSWLLSLIAKCLYGQFVPGFPEGEDSKVVVLLITMEMTRVEMERRIDAIMTGLPFHNLKRGMLDDVSGRQKYKNYLLSLKTEGHDRLYIADAGCARTVTDIEVLMSRVQPHVVLIDSFYKLTTWGARERKREERVSDVSWQIKQLALRKSVPIVATTQYNRQVAIKAKKHKHKAGGAEGAGFSYAIFQDCDLGISIYGDDQTFKSKELHISLIKNRNDPGDLAFRTEWDLEQMDFDYIGPLYLPTGGGSSTDFDTEDVDCS